VKPNLSNTQIPILSFFTGLGLLDLGFHKAGFRSVWHNEFNHDFVRGFEYGMESFGIIGPQAKIQNSRSIAEISAKQVLKEAFGNIRPSITGIIGGPPCPDFSIGGKNKGHEGERGQLTELFVNKIIDIHPTFFLLENVPGLIRTAKHRAFLRKLLIKLSAQYLLDMKVVNALEYGVPQDRERLFVVGLNHRWIRSRKAHFDQNQSPDRLIEYARDSRADGLHFHWMPWGKHKTHPDAKNAHAWPKLCPFGSTPLCPTKLPKSLMVGPLICDTRRLSRLPNGLEGFAPYSARFNTVAEGDVSKKSFKRLHRWRYSPAASYGNNEVHLHPIEPRRLTVREAMQIQTVPENFSLPPDMTLSSKFKTIGNAVPVRLAVAMAQSIRDVIESLR